jgi:hypothetical protein
MVCEIETSSCALIGDGSLVAFGNFNSSFSSSSGFSTSAFSGEVMVSTGSTSGCFSFSISGFSLSTSGSLSDEEFVELDVLDDEDELDEEDVVEELVEDVDDRRRLVDEDDAFIPDDRSLKPQQYNKHV